MAKKRLVPIPQIPTVLSAADSPSLPDRIVSPTQTISDPLETAPAPKKEEPLSRPVDIPNPAMLQQPVQPAPVSRRIAIPNMPGVTGFDIDKKEKQGFQVSLPQGDMNASQKLFAVRKENSESRGLFAKMFERPISGTIGFLAALYHTENMSDIPEVMHSVLDETALENNQRMLDKGLKGFGALFTVPGNFIVGAEGADTPLSMEGMNRGFNASMRVFGDTFSLDEWAVHEAMKQTGNIFKNPEDLHAFKMSLKETAYDEFVRELSQGRQVSDAKIKEFGIVSSTVHVAEFVIGGGGISKSAQFVIGTGKGVGKTLLFTGKTIYKAPIKTKDAVKHILNLAHGGQVKEGITNFIVKLNPVAVHEMKNMVSQRNLFSAKLNIFKTEIDTLTKELAHMKKDPNLNPDVFKELGKRLDDIKVRELANKKIVKDLDKELLKQFGADPKKLNEMFEFTDMYVPTAKIIRQNVKNLQKQTGRIVKQELEEADQLARNTAKYLRNLRKDQSKAYADEFGVTPERVVQLRDIWHDLLSVAKGKKGIKDILPVTQQLFTKGKGIKSGVRSDPVLIEVQKIIQNVHPDQRFEPLKKLFTEAFAKKTGKTIQQVDELSNSLKKASSVNDSLAAQIQDSVVDVIATATKRVSAIEREAIEQAIQIRGGLERLRKLSVEKFGKDITHLSRKQIKQLAEPLEKDIDELIAVRDLVVAENAAELGHMKHMFQKVFGIDLVNFDRADMMNRVREFELLKTSLRNIGKKKGGVSNELKEVEKAFIDKYGVTPNQFQQVEQLAADIHKTPWVQRFSSEFTDKLDYFATLTGGIKYRQFRKLIQAAPEKIIVSPKQFMKSSIVTDVTRSLRSHGTRLKNIGGPADEIAERIGRRDEESRRMAGIWKETLRGHLKGLSDDEVKALRIAMQNDKSIEKMMASISQFGQRIRPGIVAEAAKNTRELLNDIILTADDVGVEITGILDEYFPIIHKYRDMFTNERTREAFVNKIMKEGVEMSQEEFDFLLLSSQVNTGDVSALAAYASDFADLMTDLTKRSAGTVRHKLADRDQAMQILEGLGISRGSRASKNLTMSRHGNGLPGALQDPLETLNTYIERASTTINDQVWFSGAKGANQDQQIRELISKLVREDHKEEVASIFNDIVNAPKPLMRQRTMRAAATIRAINTPKLAFMAINNAAQGYLGTLWATDFSTATKAFFQAFKGEGREFARRTGAVFDNMEMQIANESGVNAALAAGERISKWQQKFLKWNGATLTEMHNRTTAALGGKLQVESMASRIRAGKQLTRKETRLIKELVFEKGDDFVNNVKSGLYDANPERWHNVLEIAGQRLARRTQLDPTGLFTREFTNSPLGSVWLQYKSFAFNQAKFMMEQLSPKRFITEIMTDPNLTRVEKGTAFVSYLSKIMAYQIAGELIGDVRTGIINLWREDKIKRPEGWERIVQNFTYVGGIGIVSDIANMALNGNKYQIMGQFIGPTGSDITTLLGGNLSEKASVVIEKLPIPVVNKSLADMAQGK